MLVSLKPPSILVSLLEQWSGGAKTKKLSTSEQKGISAESESIRKLLASPHLLKKAQLLQVSSIVEYLHQNKKTILNDKSLLWLTSSLDTSLSRTLDPDLTLKEKAFFPFWNEQREESYEKLWLPVKTDCVVSGLSLLSGSLKNTLSNSWFSNTKTSPLSRSSPKTSLPSCRFLAVDGMGSGTSAPTRIITRKLPFRINAQGRQVLRRWNNIYRFCYNRCVWYLNEGGECSKMGLRDLTKNKALYSRFPWVLDLPAAQREGAAFEGAKNFASAMSNYRGGHNSGFKMGFKRRKEKSWTISNFTQSSFIRLGDYSCSVLGAKYHTMMYTREKLPEQVNHLYSIHYDGNRFFLLLPVDDPNLGADLYFEDDARSTVAIDPGVRTFLTVYDPNGCVYDIGSGETASKLHQYALNLDKHLTAFTKGRYRGVRKKGKTKKRFKEVVRKRIDRTRLRMKNLQSELHNKAANFLTKLSKTIVIPVFASKEMSGKRRGRKINSKTVRNMSLLAHGSFRERLRTKAASRNCQVIITTEEYTSKTCGRCGSLNDKLFGSKTFKCPKCALVIDRDAGAARNIMLRALRDSSIDCKSMNEVSDYRQALLSLEGNQDEQTKPYS